MTLTGYDATHTGVPFIPLDAELILGYTGSLPAYTAEIDWTPDDWARFPNAKKLVIATHPFADGDILDIERYDASPPDLPDWYARQMARRVAPTGFYCNASTYPAVAQYRPSGCLSWGANWNNDPSLVIWVNGSAVSVDAHQYASLTNYDVSVFSDVWFPAPALLPPPTTTQVGDKLHYDLELQTNAAGQAWTVDPTPVPVDKLDGVSVRGPNPTRDSYLANPQVTWNDTGGFVSVFVTEGPVNALVFVRISYEP